MTDARRWERVGQAFDEALALDPAGRAGLLAALRAEDAALADEVASLLAEHEGSGFIAEPAPGEPGPRLYGLESDHVGPYRIIRPIGRGGMGNVFLAERSAADVTLTVALKLLRSDFWAPTLLDRFRAERRILARLEHPGIARLIDAGATPSGQPYYAMEFVDGEDIITHVRRRDLTVRERIGLFLDICGAVEYAHQQLVVHRDLKPGNILVPDDGRPRLLDFGIAKLIDPAEQPDSEVRTARWCTPEYASPEQVRGGPATTQSDVYALGALLYEILTGTRPFDLSGLSPAGIEQAVGHQPPPRPSERVRDPAVRRALQGDLDTILLKTLAKEPWRRYASAGALADDLKRHLERKPVRARPDTWGYRAIRFAQRNRLGVAAGAVVFVTLAAGLAAVSWQAAVAGRERDRAEEARRRAEDVSSLLIGLFEAARPDATAGTDTATARAILREGVARIDELEGQPAVQAQMIDALGMVLLSLERYDEANQLLVRGLDLRRAESGEESEEFAAGLASLARALRARSEYRAADSLYQKALDIRRRVLRHDDPRIAGTLLDLAAMKPYLGRNDEARVLVYEALAIRERIFGPDHLETGRALMRVAAFARLRGDHPEALDYGRRGVAVTRQNLGEDHPETGATLVALADIEWSAGDTAAAERLYREGVDIQRRALGEGHVNLLHGLGNLATVLTARGEHREAESLVRQVLAVRERTLGPESSSAAAAHEALAETLAAQGRLEEAERERRHGLETWRRAVGPEHAGVAASLASLGWLVAERGRYGEAEQMLSEAIAMRIRVLGREHSLVALTEIDLARVLIRAGRFERAEQNLLDAQRILEPQFDAGHKDRLDLDRAFLELYEAWGRPADAQRFRRR